MSQKKAFLGFLWMDAPVARVLLYAFVFMATILLLINGTPQEYEYTIFMPMAYLLCGLLLLRKNNLSFENPFVAVFLAIALLRYVAQPLLISYLSGYEGRSWVEPDLESYRIASLLMIYELLAVSMFIFLYKKNSARNKSSSELRAAPFIFSLSLLLVSILLILGNPKSLMYISFFIPNPAAKFQEIEPSIIVKVSAYTFIVAKQIFAIGLMYLFFKKYTKKKKARYKLYSAATSIIAVFIYFGVSRIDFLIGGVSMYVVYRHFFGPVGEKVLIAMALTFVLMFGYISEKRGFEAVDQTLPEKALEYTQVYTGGVYNVAIGLEVKNWFPEASSWNVLAFDLVRPLIGFNVLVKNLDIKYSNIYFNNRMWTHVDRRSQIMPMLAQSNLYFGYLFAPVLSILFAWIGMKISDYAIGAQYIEMKYFAVFCAARFGMLMGQNSMNLINEMSFSLLLPALLFIAFGLIRKALTK